MPKAIVLHLPEPPSANRYWRHAKGRTYLSPEAKAYRTVVLGVYRGAGGITHWIPEGPVSVILDWRRGRKSGDLDNRIKQVLDALQGLAYADDSQIVELHAYRSDAPKMGGMTVTVTGASQ